jgi:hypothetical protein
MDKRTSVPATSGNITEQTTLNNPSVQTEAEPAPTGLKNQSTPQTTSVSPQPQQTVIYQQQKSGCGKCSLIGCIGGILLLLLVCGGTSFGLYYVVNNSLKNFATSIPAQYENRSFAYTKKSEVTNPSGEQQPAIDENIDPMDASALIEEKIQALPAKMDTISITQEELAKSLNVDGIGLSIEPGSMVVRMSVKELVGTLELPTVLNSFKETVLYAEIIPTSDGKSFVVQDLTTGNNIMDSVVSVVGEQFVLDSINNALKPGSESGMGIKNISFEKGKVNLQLEPSAAGQDATEQQ